MSERTVWEIDFEMIGPITIDRQITFQQEKGFDMNQFYSDIKLSKSPYGINATITAYADNPDDAERVAYVYFGRMRDVLSLNSDVPIRLNVGHGNSVGRKPNIRRRVIRHSEIKTAFDMARTFEKKHKKILRAISMLWIIVKIRLGKTLARRFQKKFQIPLGLNLLFLMIKQSLMLYWPLSITHIFLFLIQIPQKPSF